MEYEVSIWCHFVLAIHILKHRSVSANFGAFRFRSEIPSKKDYHSHSIFVSMYVFIALSTA